jgi:inorganic triphosphatase YgiF
MPRAHSLQEPRHPISNTRHLTPEAPTEIELKLVARDGGVLDAVAGLRELAGYTLRRAPDQAIHDCYWDTSGRELSARKCSLRLRRRDGLEEIALKQPGQIADGLFRQPELELPVNYDNWLIIRSRIEEQGVRLLTRSNRGQAATGWLTAAGLEPTQDRFTDRRVLLAEHNGTALAELALDTTTYCLGVYDVVFREIEAEALSGEVRHVLALGRALEQAFLGRLSPSERNKYARGIELAALFADE